MKMTKPDLSREWLARALSVLNLFTRLILFRPYGESSVLIRINSKLYRLQDIQVDTVTVDSIEDSQPEARQVIILQAGE